MRPLHRFFTNSSWLIYMEILHKHIKRSANALAFHQIHSITSPMRDEIYENEKHSPNYYEHVAISMTVEHFWLFVSTVYTLVGTRASGKWVLDPVVILMRNKAPFIKKLKQSISHQTTPAPLLLIHEYRNSRDYFAEKCQNIN